MDFSKYKNYDPNILAKSGFFWKDTFEVLNNTGFLYKRLEEDETAELGIKLVTTTFDICNRPDSYTTEQIENHLEKLNKTYHELLNKIKKCKIEEKLEEINEDFN